MSAEVVDDNPYRFQHALVRVYRADHLCSRLMALSRMGVVPNYQVRCDTVHLH